MITSSLLSNARHRTMITPISPLLTSLIHISPSYWTIHRSFEIILEMGTVHRVEFKSNALCKSIVSKNFQSDIAEVSSCSNGWAWVKSERTKARENLLRTTLFYSDNRQHERERPDVERKEKNSDEHRRSQGGPGGYVSHKFLA